MQYTKLQFIALAIAFLTFTFAGQSFAQSAEITVQIWDGNNLPIAGATVEISSAAGNRSYTSDEDGRFTAESPSGKFRMKIRTTGFNTFEKGFDPGSGIYIIVLSKDELLAHTIDDEILDKTPILTTGRSSLLTSLPQAPGLIRGAHSGGDARFYGGRDRNIGYELDGITIEDITSRASSPYQINSEMVSEFRFSHENGSAARLKSRTGSNEFRGNLFYHYHTPEISAGNWNFRRAGRSHPQFLQHTFGANFSGPVINPFGSNEEPVRLLKDRAHFFLAYQGLLGHTSTQVNRLVLTPEARSGLFRWQNAGQDRQYNIPAGAGFGLDSEIQDYLNSLPLPNNNQIGDGLNTAGYAWNSPSYLKNNSILLRTDIKVDEHNSLFIRGIFDRQLIEGDNTNDGLPFTPGDKNYRIDTTRNSDNFAAGWTTVNGRFSNDLTGGVNKIRYRFENPFFAEASQFASLSTSAPWTERSFESNGRSGRSWQVRNNSTFNFEKHRIEFGGSFNLNRHFENRSTIANGNVEGVFNYNNSDFSNFENFPSGGNINGSQLSSLRNISNFLLGRIGTAEQAFVRNSVNTEAWLPAGSRWNNEIDFYQVDFFGNYSWKPATNLLLRMGGRFETKFAPRAVELPFYVSNQSVTLGSPNSNSLKWEEGELFNTDLIFLPSAGFAWDVNRNGKNIIRGAYQIHSDHIATQLLADLAWRVPGNSYLERSEIDILRRELPVNFNLSPTASPTSLSQPAAFGTGSINTIDPGLKFPRVHFWTAGYQRDVFGQGSLEINYIGRKGTHLHGGYNSNQVKITDDFLQEFNLIRNDPGYSSPLINSILNSPNGTTAFRNFAGFQLQNGSAAAAAQLLSQRTCGSAEVTAGVCTAGQAGQRLLALAGNEYFFQPFSQFTGGLYVIDSNDFSFYNGLELRFNRNFKKGLAIQATYNYSLSKDTRSFDPVFTAVPTGGIQSAANTAQDPYDRRANYSYSDFDRRHSFYSSATWLIPSPKDLPAAAKVVLKDWRVIGIFSAASGRPFSVFSGLNTYSNSVQSFANCDGCQRNMGGLSKENGQIYWFTSNQFSKFTQPAPGEVGNTGRNFFLGPKEIHLDAAFSKRIRLSERFSFDLQAEALNLLNKPVWGLPNANIPANGNIANSLFGRIGSQEPGSDRRLQFGFKFNF